MSDLTKLMGTLNDTLQELDSLDCGFFACYALMILETRKSGCREHRFCQRDVYVMREKYRGSTPSPNAVLEMTPDDNLNKAKCVTTPQAAKTFLSNTLGVTGYQAYDRATSGDYNVNLSDHKTAQALLRNNVNVLSKPAGMLLALGYNHWIAILGKQNEGPNPMIIGYNPALGLFSSSLNSVASDFQRAGTILMRGLPPGHG